MLRRALLQIGDISKGHLSSGAAGRLRPSVLSLGVVGSRGDLADPVLCMACHSMDSTVHCMMRERISGI